MKTLSFLSLILFFLASNIQLKAQNQPEEIEKFKSQIDSLLNSFRKDPSFNYIETEDDDRKIRINGKFDHDTKYFEHTIRYGDGIKKEILTVRYSLTNNEKFLIKIVLIDDSYFYVKKHTYASNSFKHLYTEILVDGRIYQKIEIHNQVDRNNRFYIWKMKAK